MHNHDEQEAQYSTHQFSRFSTQARDLVSFDRWNTRLGPRPMLQVVPEIECGHDDHMARVNHGRVVKSIGLFPDRARSYDAVPPLLWDELVSIDIVVQYYYLDEDQQVDRPRVDGRLFGAFSHDFWVLVPARIKYWVKKVRPEAIVTKMGTDNAHLTTE